MWRRGIALAVLVCLTGCSSPVARVDATSFSAREARDAAKIAVIAADRLVPRHARELISIESYACVDPFAGEDAAREDAVRQLRIKAYRIGANAVVHLAFEARGALALVTDCSQTITASGVAAHLGP